MKKRLFTTGPTPPPSYAHRILHEKGRMRKILLKREAVIQLLADLDAQIKEENCLFHAIWNIREEIGDF